MVRDRDVIGIFDLETSSMSKITREYLKRAEEEGRVRNVNYELPTSFVVMNDGGEAIVYTSQISSHTLAKRAGVKEGIVPCRDAKCGL